MYERESELQTTVEGSEKHWRIGGLKESTIMLAYLESLERLVYK